MRSRRLVVLAALAACGDNRAGPVDAAPPPLPDAPPNEDAGPTLDLFEGPEPNGLGVIETSSAPAGVVTAQMVGTRFTIGGELVRFEDRDHDGVLDPDVDTYLVMFPQRGRTRIAVTGAGFRIANPAESYEDFGTSGELDLPVAGTYQLSIASAQIWIVGGDSNEGNYTVALEQLSPDGT